MVKKSFDALEEIRLIKRGKVEVVDLGRAQAIRVTFEPGWRWLECVKPIVGTNGCQVAHLFRVISGKDGVPNGRRLQSGVWSRRRGVNSSRTRCVDSWQRTFRLYRFFKGRSV